MYRRHCAWLAIALVSSPAAFAADQCVNPGGSGGCLSSINAAIAAAGPNDTVRVAHGTYAENVVIDKPLALLGESEANTVIDATDLANGIDIDGHGHPGLGHVIVKDFKVANANFQGILVTDATDVTVTDNHVTGNNRSLVLPGPDDETGPTCPGIPVYFEAGEGFDCGEGIHLSGVTFSTVSDNLVDHNAGGILVSDDTGASHDNLITGNRVQDNPYDCGITLASHHFVQPMGPPLDPVPVDLEAGVYHITVSKNISTRNGLVTGEGAGVGIFAGPPGAQNWGDVVVGNILYRNGLPGVTLHSHTINQILDGHLIANNMISGNGPDSDPGTTVPTGIVVFGDAMGGAPPITGVQIFGNTILGEGIDLAVSTSGDVAAHENNFFGKVGIDNLGTGSVNATLNWWKCPYGYGPQAEGCANVTGDDVQVAPQLSKPANNGEALAKPWPSSHTRY